MKNKNNRFLCILMCVVLVASIFTACSKVDEENPTTTLATADVWQNEIPEDVSYSKVTIDGVELADIISGALGEEYRDTSVNELTDAEKDKVKDYASDKGYIVDEDNDGNLVIQKPAVEAPTEVISDLYAQASVKDPSNLTPEEITRLSQVAASNNYQIVTNPQGDVNVVKPTLVPPTSKPVVTKQPNNNAEAYKTTIRVEIPSYNPPTQATSPMGTTLPRTKLVRAGWLKTYGNSAHHTFSSCEATPDGGIVAVGASLGVGSDEKASSYGAIIAKYDKSGKLIWHDAIAANYSTQFEDVIVLKDGSIIAVGQTSATKLDDVTDADFKCIGSIEGMIVKYSADGTKKFTKMIGGSGADMIYGAAASSDGGFYIGGKSNSTDADLKGIGTQPYKAFTMKMDANANIKWTSALSASVHASVKGIAEAADGSVYSTIETVADDGEFASLTGVKKGLETSVLVKYDKAGNQIWANCYYGSGRTQIHSISATADGGCMIAGQYAAGINGNSGTFSEVYNGGNTGTFDGVVMKINPNGKTTWMKTIVGFQSDFITDIAPVPGGFALSGYTSSTNRDFSLKNVGGIDGFVYVISAYGELQTVSSFGGSAADNIRAICSNGRTVFVAGHTFSADGSFLKCEVKGADGKGAALVHQFTLEAA